MNILSFGTSATPPGVHHKVIVQRLTADVAQPGDRVIVRPCGDRPDKPTTNGVPAVHRAAMAMLEFSQMRGVELDLSDLTGQTFTRTFDLDQRLRKQNPGGRIWHVVGADLISGGADNQSTIQLSWYRGRELWQQGSFLVIPRNGTNLSQADLPPNARVIDIGIPGSSSEIRRRVYAGESIHGLVSDQIEAYIEKYGLFKGLGRPRIIADQTRERTAALHAATTRAYADRTHEPVNHILVIGGDGYMLRAIRTYAHLNLPFVGLHAGTVGFLANDGTPEEIEERLRRGALRYYHQPMLVAEVEGLDEPVFAFNELFLKTNSGQSTWLRVTIDGKVRFQKIVGDGLMVSTAAGSTGWARSYGAQPILIGTPMNILTGVGAQVNGRPWSWAPLSIHSVIEIESIGTDKRPVTLLADGVDEGVQVTQVRICPSQHRTVTLGFFPETDLAERLSRLHFPS